MDAEILVKAFIALATFLGPAWVTWNNRKNREAVVEHFDRRFWSIVKTGMEEAARKAGPEKTLSIRISFLAGNYVVVPLTDEWIIVDISQARIQLIEHNTVQTDYQLDCPNPYQIAGHSHPEEESVTVITGSMLDLDSGRTYRPGETWTLPPNHPHHVFFSPHTRVHITIRPPLPSSATVPLALETLHMIGT